MKGWVATPIWRGEAPERPNVFEERLVLLNKAHRWTCTRAEPWSSAGPATPPNLGGSPTFHFSPLTQDFKPLLLPINYLCGGVQMPIRQAGVGGKSGSSGLRQ